MGTEIGTIRFRLLPEPTKLVAARRQSVHQGIPAELDPDTLPVALPEDGTLFRHIDISTSTSTNIPSSGMRGTEMVCMRPIGTWG